MRWINGLHLMALTAVIAGGYPAAAQVVAVVGERFSAFALHPTAAPTTFAPPVQPAVQISDIPMPRPARRMADLHRRSSAPAESSSARNEELLRTAYAAPAADRSPQSADNFTAWLPRLLPMGIEAPAPVAPAAATPSNAASAPPAVERPAERSRARRAATRPISDELEALIAAKAHKHGVPVSLAHAVVTVESNYNPNVTGRGATLGLMQIKYATARGIGFTGSAKDLFDPATNLEWGMRYLAGARKLAKGDLCGTVLRYQGGHRAVRMTRDASVYCAKVRRLLGASSVVAEARPLSLRP